MNTVAETVDIHECRGLRQISNRLYRFEDTCHVYVLRSGREAVLVDFGAGDVLPLLERIGVERVTDVVMTHHHRDQGQGLVRAVEAGARIWVPHMEQDLFHSVDCHWQARELTNNYNVRQDRFSLLEPVPVAGTLHDYAGYRFGDDALLVLPTPGHTAGSISLMAEIDGSRVAFTGDLIAGPGKVWSLAATQWTYNKAEGVAATMASLVDLKARAPDLLLPSHGEPMAAPEAAIDLLVERLWRLLCARGENPRFFSLYWEPYEAVTPHLLRNRTSVASSYVLLSESSKALLIDYGYDFVTGYSAGADRASRRPWLYTLPTLKRQYGVETIDVVIPTHYHDDHVAGFNLLRRVEGTQVWAPETFADLLERPRRYDLPCIWYDPIPVDRALPLGRPIRWEEYELTLYEQPGHTHYAVAIALEVDGRRALAIGDQYEKEDRWNYVYQNRVGLGDYRRSAALYRELRPDLLLPGHYEPIPVTPEHLDRLAERGELFEQLHRDLLPLESLDFGLDGAGLRLRPYQSEVRGGEPVEFDVEVRNPFPRETEASLRLITPQGWEVDVPARRLRLRPGATERVAFRARPPAGCAVRRARVAADLTIESRHFGQQAEAVVTVTRA